MPSNKNPSPFQASHSDGESKDGGANPGRNRFCISLAIWYNINVVCMLLVRQERGENYEVQSY